MFGSPLSPEHWEQLGANCFWPDIPAPDLGELARTYVELSELHHAHPESTGARVLGTADSDIHQAVRWLVFARRTYRILVSLRPFSRPTPVVVDHGAGLAPGLHAFAYSGSTLHALEHQPGYEAPRKKLLSLRGLEATSATPPAPASDQTHIFAFSLAEISGRAGVQAWKRIEPLVAAGAQVILLEAGDGHHAEFLRLLRDAATEAGFAPTYPCPDGVRSCPMGERPRDWCHFTQRHQPGPLETRLVMAARRNPHHHHFSAVLFNGPEKTSGVLLGHRSPGKSKHVAQMCGTAGLNGLTALRRHRAAFDALQSLPAGSAVEIEASASLRGDGFRIEDTDQMSVVAMPLVD